jgi:transposase-like protein
VEQVITATLEQAPPGGDTHWSTRSMARSAGVSQSAVSRIWRAFGLKPHLVQTWKLSTDPQFIDKVRDVVGLYMAPPQDALVLCVDEKSQIQALDRTAPCLPLLPTTPARITHDGTVALVDRGWPETGRMTARRTTSVFAGFRFPPEVISLAVRWYLRYGLSYRDVEELMAERGITVDHVTIYRWVRRFTPEFTGATRPCRHAPGDRWFAGETYGKVAGAWTYLYRAVDQHGQVIDVLLPGRRDLAAARRFFTRALRAGAIPVEVTTDRAPVYPRVLDELVPLGAAHPQAVREQPGRG